MNIDFTAELGMLFAILGFTATFLMYHLWGYPFDKEKKRSEAPRSLMYLHRALGYAFVLCYVLLMWQMLPRMWEYQVEFPARTVAHIILGFTIGFILLIKISIMRFFRHFEEWMPYLGTGLLLCTVLLLGLSMPAAAKERALAERAFRADNIARVRGLLPGAGMPADADLDQLATASALARGRQVLLRNCVRCHDLKTILRKPRTPADWWRTVERMGDKPALFDPIEIIDSYRVTAYLVAITPDLQKSQKRLREEALKKAEAMAAAEASEMTPPVATDGDAGVPDGDAGAAAAPAPGFTMAEAREAYEEECALCHELSEVEAAPPTTRKAIDELLQRMIDENDAEFEPDSIERIKHYLAARFVDKTEK